jgi:hypothetical protein
MLAMAGSRLPIDAKEFAPRVVRATVRDVVSAWIVAVLLLIGAVVSVTFDNLVTVSADPPATYSAMRDAIAAEEALNEDPAAQSQRVDDTGP